MTGVLPTLELSGNEQKVYDALKEASESSIDEVIRRSGLQSSTVSVALLELEMKRVVKQLPGKMFVRNIAVNRDIGTKVTLMGTPPSSGRSGDLRVAAA